MAKSERKNRYNGKFSERKNILVKCKNFWEFIVDFVFNKLGLKQFVLKILAPSISVAKNYYKYNIDIIY